MKKNDFLFLIRFLIITLIYFLEFIFLGEDFFILDIVLHPVFFPFMLVMYLMTIVVSFFCGEGTTKIIKVVSDSVFMLLFTLQTILRYKIEEKLTIGKTFFHFVYNAITWLNRPRVVKYIVLTIYISFIISGSK